MNLMKLKGHSSMLGANVMWGLMSPVAKFVMVGGAVTPLVVTDLRITGAMVLFWMASFFQKPERVAPKDLLKLLGASLLAIVFNQGCFIFGVGLTSPVDASIITTSMPLLAMVLAAIYLKEPITGKKVLGIAVGAAGALLLILGSHQVSEVKAAGNHYIWGDLLVLLAQFSYALYFVLFKNFVNKYSLITIMKWMFTYAFICALPFSYNDLLHTEWKSLQGTEIGALVFIVVGSTFISYVLIVIGQKNLRPTVAGMYNYVQPLVASIVAVCWGMDTFNFVKIISVALIFGGVYLVTSSRSKAEMEAVAANNN
ncbi:MAG: DMT family transporter [Odoribacter splanchnicus]